MKKAISVAASVLMTAALTVPAFADEIKVWVPEATVEFTKTQIETFKEENPDFADYDYVVEAVGEGDAASSMIRDVEAGADIFNFAQDQLARLVVAGAVEEVAPENIEALENDNDAGSVGAAKVGDTYYAYPLTSDNGYFLYYDKSGITDPTSLEQILADCEAAGKNFYMEINSGWYQTAFFFATGCELTYDTNDASEFVKCNINYASEEGLAALKAMIALKASPAFQNGSSVGSSINAAAIVDGTWDSDSAKELFGENYACAKLPTFTVGEETYQMSGFGGFKLLGVKPQDDEDKLAACDALAAYLSSGDVQLARFQEVGWGPSNLEAQKDDSVQANEALAALGEQLAFTIPQGQYPNGYWSLATSLGDDIIGEKLTVDSSDEDLMAALEKFEEACISYLDAEGEEEESETAEE